MIEILQMYDNALKYFTQNERFHRKTKFLLGIVIFENVAFGIYKRNSKAVLQSDWIWLHAPTPQHILTKQKYARRLPTNDFFFLEASSQFVPRTGIPRDTAHSNLTVRRTWKWILIKYDDKVYLVILQYKYGKPDITRNFIGSLLLRSQSHLHPVSMKSIYGQGYER